MNKLKPKSLVVAKRSIPEKGITKDLVYRVRFHWVFSREIILVNDNKAAVAAPENAFIKLTIKQRIIRLWKSLLKRK